MTDPTQAPINKTLMLKLKSMHNAFHTFHTILRLQAGLNHLEAVTSFSSPEAKTLLDHFQQEYVKLERRAKNIKADSFLHEWVSLRERYVIVDHRAQDQLRKDTAFTDVRSDPVTSVSRSSPGHHDSSASHTSIAAPPKAKLPKLPLPVWKGDLQEWRAFGRRFVQVTETCTSDKDKPSYLLESLQDSGAATIAKQSISNGDTFDDVAERLKKRYDKPMEVFLQALKTFTRSSPLDYENHSSNSLATDVHKATDTLKRYGDGTTTQLPTGLLKLRMTSDLKREWVRIQYHLSTLSLSLQRSSMLFFQPLRLTTLVNTNHVIRCHRASTLHHCG